MSSEKNHLPRKFDIDFSSLRDMARQMDSFFNQSFRQMNPIFEFQPFLVDIQETNTDFIVTAELPGYKRDQIQIEILGNRLRIAVEDSRKVEELNEEKKHIHHRHSFQRKERFVTLPFEIPEEE